MEGHGMIGNRWLVTLALLLAQMAPAVYAQEPSARDLVDRIDTSRPFSPIR